MSTPAASTIDTTPTTLGACAAMRSPWCLRSRKMAMSAMAAPTMMT